MINGEIQTADKSTKKITSIEQWTDAFIVYASIYLAAHPAKTLDMLKYLNDVRLAASRSGDLGFRDYDQQFRLRMEHDPSLSWGEVDSELWLLYLVPNSRNMAAASTYQGQKRMCYSYNYQGSCFKAPCNYIHACLRCSGQHPVAFCPNQARSDNNFRGQGRGNFRGQRGCGNQFRGGRGSY